MKCRKCGVEYSARVLKIHETICNVKAEPKKEDKIDWKDLADKAGIEGEDLKKFMRKSSKNRQIQLDKLKD
ncbi:MAG: hypothetical protein GY928_24270 [Colwellia sp.]|nr:hypothetical protein [Colwellia sp.]